MKRKVNSSLLLLIVLFLSTTAWGQNNNYSSSKFSFDMHAGYANMVRGTSGLTSNSDSYVNKLQSGVTWDINLKYKPAKRFSIGLLYSGFISSGSLPESSDKVQTHYVAPQANIHFGSKRWQGYVFGGLGVMAYKNNGEVFEKSRYTHNSTIAGNVGIALEYRITDVIGLGISTQYILANYSRLHVHYHDEPFNLEFPRDERLHADRLNISLGLNFHF